MSFICILKFTSFIPICVLQYITEQLTLGYLKLIKKDKQTKIIQVILLTSPEKKPDNIASYELC